MHAQQVASRDLKGAQGEMIPYLKQNKIIAINLL